MSFQDLESGGDYSRIRDYDPMQPVLSAASQIKIAVSKFQRYVTCVGTPMDTPDLRARMDKTRSYIMQLTHDAKAKLDHQDFRSICEESCDNKKSVAKLAIKKELHETLNDFLKVTRLAAQRQAEYPNPPLPMSTNSYATVNDEQDTTTGGVRVHEASLVLENEIVFNEALIEERAQEIEEVRQQVLEINEIMRDLAGIVKQQGDVFIDVVQPNIARAHEATTQATKFLEDARTSQKSTSSPGCIVLMLVSLILIIMLVVIVA